MDGTVFAADATVWCAGFRRPPDPASIIGDRTGRTIPPVAMTYVGITVSGSRQHTHRARRRIAAAGHDTGVDRAAARRVVEAFVDAASSGRTERLVALLADGAPGWGCRRG